MVLQLKYDYTLRIHNYHTSYRHVKVSYILCINNLKQTHLRNMQTLRRDNMTTLAKHFVN